MVAALASLALNADNPAAAAGIPQLVAVLHAGTAEAKESAAGALWSLAVKADNQVAIVQAGALLPLIELLSSGSPLAQQRAASALSNLAVTDSHRQLIADAGGLAPLIALLPMSNAAQALKNLALHGATREEMRRLGCPEKF